MSKGKQWWPLQSTVTDVKKVLTDFQQRLRDKNWLRNDHGLQSYHVYILEGSPTLGFESVNDYMQFSANDSSVKNMLRVQVLRASCMMFKWQTLMGDVTLQGVPKVFLMPSVDHVDQVHVGIIATWQHHQKTMSMIVCEAPLSDETVFFGNKRYMMCPQKGNSYQWMTQQTWKQDRVKPSFVKWMNGRYPDRRAWVEALDPLHDATNGVFALSASGDKSIKALKRSQACWLGKRRQWILPDFVDKEAWLALLKTLPSDTVSSNPNRANASSYGSQFVEKTNAGDVEHHRAYAQDDTPDASLESVSPQPPSSDIHA